MIDTLVHLTLGATRVLPAVEMLRDFSEAAEAEAKAGASALFGLGAFAGTGSASLAASIALFAVAQPWVALPFLLVSSGCAAGGYFCKKRLDVTKAKLEQLRGAALASRAAKAIGGKALDLAVAAASGARSGGKAASRAVESAASEVANLPSAAIDATAPIGRAASQGANAAYETAAAAAAALADPATRKAAADLSKEAIHGLARGAGYAAGWIKSRSAGKNTNPNDETKP